MQLTLADFQNRVWGRLDNNQAFYPVTQVNGYINEAARVVNLYCGFSQDSVYGGMTAAVVPGGGPQWLLYRIPSPIVYPMKIYLAGKEIRKCSPSQVSETVRTWLRGSKENRQTLWVPIGLKMYALVPPDPVGGRIIQVMGVTSPNKLVNTTDTLNLDDSNAGAIEDLAVIGLTYKEPGKTFSDASRGFQVWVKKMQQVQIWTTILNPMYSPEMVARAMSK